MIAEMVQATDVPMGPPTIADRQVSPDGPRVLTIASERDAAAAFGENSDWHLWLRAWFERPRPEPVILTRRVPDDEPRGE